jgi:hypothetical protein
VCGSHPDGTFATLETHLVPDRRDQWIASTPDAPAGGSYLPGSTGRSCVRAEREAGAP